MLCRVFYDVVCGKKDVVKKVLLNECLSLCARKWFNLNLLKKDPDNPVPLAPSSFDVNMRHLFSEFREFGMEYNYDRDFNKKAEFHGILKDTWDLARKKDPSFGAADVKGEFDERADEMIRDAVAVGKLNIHSNVEEMQFYLVFCCSRYGGFRGGKEIYNAKWNQFELGTIKKGACKGLRYMLVSFPDGTKSKLF